jgi:hypothetical protein
MSNLDDLVSNLKAVKEELKKNARGLFLDHIKELMVAPVQAVRWTQYTPYFNDGEPCEFSVCEPYFQAEGVTDESRNWYNDGDDFFTPSGNNYSNDPAAVACKALEKAFNAIPDEVFECAFGDHVEVTIERSEDGSLLVTVEEYDHD